MMAGADANLAVLITSSLAILLAWIISTTVEWPAQRWLRARFAAYRGRFSGQDVAERAIAP